jgi:hypothetical protein
MDIRNLTHRWSGAAVAPFLIAAACALCAHAQDRLSAAKLDYWRGLAASHDDSEEQFAEDEGVIQAALLNQPPALSQPAAPAQPAPRRGTVGARQSGVRLASVPNMFGDLAMTTATAFFFSQREDSFVSSIDIPTSQSIRSAKIAENDTPIPVDRIFFNYNHFHNLFEVRELELFSGTPPIIRQEPLDRFTVGFEKTFFDGLASVELRMPFNGTYDTQLENSGIDGGNVGNLAVVLKGLMYDDGMTAVGAGVALSTPTGSDTDVRFGGATLRFNNEALHVLPYIGFIHAPGDPSWGWNDGLFLTGFAQLDLAASGNTIDGIPEFGDPFVLGTLTEQNLLYLDLGAGYWFFRDPYAPRWTGVALVGEFHYTTAIQDADLVGNPLTVAIGNPANRFDIVNGTLGLQFLMFEASSLRVAGVFPLGDEDHRFFDAEFQVQFNRRF